MLGDCHRRIERFLNALLTVATGAKGGPLTNEQQAALSTGLRYFREAAPKHTACTKKRVCSQDYPDSIIPICNRCWRKSTLYKRITNAPREATAKSTIWVNCGWQMAGCHLRMRNTAQPC